MKHKKVLGHGLEIFAYNLKSKPPSFNPNQVQQHYGKH